MKQVRNKQGLYAWHVEADGSYSRLYLNDPEGLKGFCEDCMHAGRAFTVALASRSVAWTRSKTRPPTGSKGSPIRGLPKGTMTGISASRKH